MQQHETWALALMAYSANGADESKVVHRDGSWQLQQLHLLM
jgi:hypothetical protein